MNPESEYYTGKNDILKPEYEQVINVIHKAGGLAFLAHPYEYSLDRYANPEEPKIPIQTWMRNKNVISFLGLWEQMHNKNFKGIEFEIFENEAGKNSFLFITTFI